jgi:hypothetical protein
MRKILGIGAALVMFAANTLSAETRPVVVELFTSQGCSSCPPADAFMHKLAARDDVIALALHVDYWDYIGWKDVFGSRANTERQHAYARTAGRRSVYTPQMIIAGQDDVVGNHPMDVADLVKVHAARAPEVDLKISRSGTTLAISATARRALGNPATVQLVRYLPKETVKVTRGENAGKTLSYSNIVSEWTVLGTWDGRSAYKVTTAVRGAQPVVVIVQRAGHGPILAAARLR